MLERLSPSRTLLCLCRSPQSTRDQTPRVPPRHRLAILANVCPLSQISSGFLFVKCASRQPRVSLSSITGQSNCPLIYCIIAELHFQMPSFRYFSVWFLYGFLYTFPTDFVLERTFPTILTPKIRTFPINLQPFLRAFPIFVSLSG